MKTPFISLFYKRKSVAIITAIVVFSAFGLNLHAQYFGFRIPKTPEFSLSTTFKVEIQQQDSVFKEVPVSKYTVPESGYVTKTENFAMFAFEPSTSAITVRISMVNGLALSASTIEVVNKQVPALTSTFENGKLLVTTLSNKCQILVRLKADYGNQLVLMANPYAERTIPAGAKVQRFTYAGSPNIQTAQYDRYEVPNDVDVVYIEEGAVLKGTIHTASGRSKPLVITGRGIIMGNGALVSGTSGIPYNALEINDGSGHIIEGITSISPRHFNIRMSDNSLISNVKMFGYNANIDGIVAGTGSVIENCYSKVNDDHVKLYNNNITVRNCCYYEQTNGGLFQFAWNSIKPGSNCLVDNCEILAWEAGCGDPKLGQGGVARSFINLRSTDAGTAGTNNTFRNIYIQGQMVRFVCINGLYDGSKPVSITNTKLENIIIEKKPSNYSWLYTGSPHALSFSFKNVTIAGQKLTAANYEFRTEGNVTLTYDTDDAVRAVSVNKDASIKCSVNGSTKILTVYNLQKLSNIVVTDGMGRVVLSQKLCSIEDLVQIQLPKNIPSGMYYICVVADGLKRSTKILIQ